MAEAKKNEVEVKQNNGVSKPQQKAGITTFLSSKAVKDNIATVVGEKNTTRFISSVVSAVQTTPALAECTNVSILNAALLGEALNLTPSPQLGQFYLVPYNNRKAGRKEAQFQIGYKGYIQLAIRSGQYRKITVSEVKQGELKSYNPITEEFEVEPVMDFERREKLPVAGYYAMFELINGFRKEIYWTKERMEHHAITYSDGYRSDKQKHTSYTFWTKAFDEMAKKTLLRQLINKWGIMSIDMQIAYKNDMAVIDENGTPTYVDNVVDVEETVAEEIKENANQTPFEPVVDVEAVDVSNEPKQADIASFLED
jgi:recombination protein RecT